jgi:ribosomal protein L19
MNSLNFFSKKSLKFLFNLPAIYVNEKKKVKPKISKKMIGNLVKFSYKHPFRVILPKKRSLFLKAKSFLGFLIGIKNKGLATSFYVRNVVKKKPILLNIFLYSPLVESFLVMSQKSSYKGRSKLFFLKKKPLRFSRIRVIERSKNFS